MGQWASPMEGMVANMEFWKGKRVLITGHTGFKGSWLSFWLRNLGAEVIGYALEPPTETNLFNILKLEDSIISIKGDIRDGENIKQIVAKYKPEIIFHLAAQPLVRKSYNNPLETLGVNILGTAAVLDAIRGFEHVKVFINVTSDKCYENKEWLWGYREEDALGGDDPYSCSKGCSELITKSYRKSFFKENDISISTARAGNVIGGGDWAEDRLVPDIVRAIIEKDIIKIRSPYALRPWQHVLEPIYGYMVLAEKMWVDAKCYGQAWNFGPNEENIIVVKDIMERMRDIWNGNINYVFEENVNFHESQILKLDSAKAKKLLNWKPRLDISMALLWTVEWYENFMSGEDMEKFTDLQIRNYEKLL